MLISPLLNNFEEETMILYTVQMSSWRKAMNKGIPFLDVTVKSGDKQFAPQWGFLMDYKRDLDEDAYTRKFIPLMRENFKNNKQYWLDILSKESLAIGCYCAKDKSCHRYLLVDIFRKVCEYYNIDFEYGGEL